MDKSLKEVSFMKDSSGAWNYFIRDKVGIELSIQIMEVSDGWGYHVSYIGLDEDDPRNTEKVYNDRSINTSSYDGSAGGYTKENIVKNIKQKLRYLDGKHSYSIVSQVASATWKFSSNNSTSL